MNNNITPVTLGPEHAGLNMVKIWPSATYDVSYMDFSYIITAVDDNCARAQCAIPLSRCWCDTIPRNSLDGWAEVSNFESLESAVQLVRQRRKAYNIYKNYYPKYIYIFRLPLPRDIIQVIVDSLYFAERHIVWADSKWVTI